MIPTTLTDEGMETVSVLGEIKTNQDHNARETGMRRNRTNSMEQRFRRRQPATTGWQERQVYVRAGRQPVSPRPSPSPSPSSMSSADYGKENNFFLATSYEDGLHFTFE
mmetsp:Transcript_28446/g.57826  ORF Transcript_28446/g.57826 Transcript_28446/m.57826 type:complete len:109 (-) Transcript_28446:913-1239(-)